MILQNHMKKLATRVTALALVSLPALAFAQNFGRNGFLGLLDAANTLINRIIPFIIALTILVFLWGVFRFVTASDPDKRKEAQGYILWGIVGLFVMVSVWGLVNILVRTFSLDNNAPALPQVPTTYTSN